MLDTSVRMGTIIGTVNTGTSNGSLSVPDVAKGTPFFFVNCPSEPGAASLLPTVYFSGTTLVWSFLGGTSYSTNFSVNVIYGFY
ncbi:hypothetical protein D9M69_662630 [compost metagenome]